ncbi:AI-2E family transporter [Patescibacteria group bacterium]|nr:AI-2E family transporter [Patescibacteria group bacterium]
MSTKPFDHGTIARWFFLALSLVVGFLFWKIIEPFAITIITAVIIAILVAPVERRLRTIIKRPHLSAAIIVVCIVLLIVGPLTLAGFLMVQQALDIVRATIANPEWVASFNLAEMPLFKILPVMAQEYLLSFKISSVFGAIAEWITVNLPGVFAGGATLILKFSIFLLCVYFFLVERERIFEELTSLSPLQDSIDRNLVTRMIETVRGVVFGSLIVALIQGFVATIGFTIFGVPGPFIWGAVVVIAAQIPMLGTAAVTVPAGIFLLLSGNIVGGIGLLIWAAVAVGLVDNLVQPYIVGGRTKMHALLILLSMLGGLQYFGPIGFILGPTILAAFLVVLELYKAGILERARIGS